VLSVNLSPWWPALLLDDANLGVLPMTRVPSASVSPLISRYAIAINVVHLLLMSHVVREGIKRCFLSCYFEVKRLMLKVTKALKAKAQNTSSFILRPVFSSHSTLIFVTLSVTSSKLKHFFPKILSAINILLRGGLASIRRLLRFVSVYCVV